MLKGGKRRFKIGTTTIEREKEERYQKSADETVW